MPQSAAPASSVRRTTRAPAPVRVSITSDTRRVDLVLPGAVPVAELVPELARSVGVLEPETAPAGYRLLLADGRVLDTDRGLTSQGVLDGDVVAVVAGVQEAPPCVYDDVVEAMAHVVERDLERWDARAGRLSGLGTAVLLLLVGVVALLLQHGSGHAAAVSVATALLLVTGAIWIARVREEPVVAVIVAMTGCVYAVAGGLSVAWSMSGSAVWSAGCGALVAGAAAALGLSQGRVVMFPVVVGGAACLAAGSVLRLSAMDPAPLLTGVLWLLVVLAGGLPRLASGIVDAGFSEYTEDATDMDGIDTDRLAADAALAHEILVAVSAAVGVLLVLLAPVAVSCGPAGCATAVLSSGVVALRARHARVGIDVMVNLASGVLGLVSTAVSVLWLRPEWGATTATAVPAFGLLVLVLSRWRPPRSRIERLGDRLESLALIALVPLVVLVTTGASFGSG